MSNSLKIFLFPIKLLKPGLVVNDKNGNKSLVLHWYITKSFEKKINHSKIKNLKDSKMFSLYITFYSWGYKEVPPFP